MAIFSAEDIELWKAATRNVRRFLHMLEPPEIEEKQIVSRETIVLTPAKPTLSAGARHFEHCAAMEKSLEISPLPPTLKLRRTGRVRDDNYYLSEGEQGRMDKNAFARLKKGNLRADLVEDLHGMNVFDARLHFYEFIQNAHASGKRSILLITGKGFAAPSKIRSSLANWINDPALKPLILAYCRAQSKDGGDGAFYIYLGKL